VGRSRSCYDASQRHIVSHRPHADGSSELLVDRDVAQPGSALDWGSRGRGFESRHPDQIPLLELRNHCGMSLCVAEIDGIVVVK
jgi:hypothetical protein